MVSNKVPTKHRSSRGIRCPWLACYAPLVALLMAGAASAQDVPDLEEQAIHDAVAAVTPSVVRIETLGGREKVEDLFVSEGPTTGLVIGDDGYILSSSFNFVHEPASILVTTPAGKRAAAKIVARDRARMLVLLKISTEEKLPVPTIAPLGELQVGQYAIAVGRTLDGKQPNISVGIVSALSRAWGRAVQSDAKISPANYGGPLIDIQGRVIGVLTPMAVMGEGELSGAQFYDSGIGFAAPLDDWLPRLDVLKSGKDLHSGVMGISLKPGDIYAQPALIAVCQINSPAYQAGLRAGDKIVEAGGMTIVRQVQLRQALGRHYAGDKVNFVVLRGEQRIEASLELVERLEPFEYPMLGILPMRIAPQADTPGVTIRYVFPGGPAEAAKLKAGDRIAMADGKPAASVDTLQQVVAAHDPKVPLSVQIKRGEESLDLTVQLTPLTNDIPEDLPPALASELTASELPAAEKAETGLIEVKLPEEKQECFIYVPASYHAAVPHALLVWFAPPGQFDKSEVQQRWQELAEKYHWIVMAPRPGEAGKWNPSEVEVVRKFIENIASRYNVDKSRIVVHGQQASGTMTWFTALANRNLIRGVVPVDAALPARATIENDPVHRLSIYSLASKKSPAAVAIEAGHKRLKAGKVPLVVRSQDAADKPNADQLSPETLAELARWIDALDRI